MLHAKEHIIEQLQKELLRLHGAKIVVQNNVLPKGLQFLHDHLPQSGFPTGAIHEFICDTHNSVSTAGFVSALISTLMIPSVIVWISAGNSLFPPAFNQFTIDPGNIIFIQLQKEKELLWATEEALKCKGLAAVVCELQELSFTSSRRLQLVVEQSAVTGFVLRINHRKLLPTACVSRWQITCLPSVINGLPGVGFPKWNVELLKMRNGKSGSWQVEWNAGKFHLHEDIAAIEFEEQKKTG